MKFLSRNFFRGILFLAPISLTVYIAYVIFEKIDVLGRKVLGNWIEKEAMLTGIGFLFTILFIVLVGYLSSIWIADSFFKWVDRQFVRSPLARGITAHQK